MMKRCVWVTEDPVYINYHDNEWGRPSYDDRYLFEMLSLEGAQAGLSWLTILKRREAYRQAFDEFDPSVVANYDEAKIQELLGNAGIIRNQLKIRSVVSNAHAFIAIQKEYGSFHQYLWRFVNDKPIINDWKTSKVSPVSTQESEDLSKNMKKHGFKFVGPVICYAFMQAVGLVNDHEPQCYLNCLNSDA